MANILVVGPHPDDQELGMGGTIASLAARGHDVLLLDLTDGEPTPHGDPATRAVEAKAAADILGVRRMLLGLPNRSLMHTVEARRLVASVIRAHQSSIIFAPYFHDAHPDHIAATRITEDARFDAKLTKLDFPSVTIPGPPPVNAGQPIYPRRLFYYYATHLRIIPDPSFLFDITGHEQTKRDAILAYRSQFVTNEKNRRVVDWIEAAGTYFGSRIGTNAAEPFFTKEPLGLNTLDAVL